MRAVTWKEDIRSTQREEIMLSSVATSLTAFYCKETALLDGMKKLVNYAVAG